MIKFIMNDNLSLNDYHVLQLLKTFEQKTNADN